VFRPWRLRGGAAAGSDGFRPLVVGIVNATPDSFFDGGNHPDAESAAAHGLKLWEEGADLIDVGGESTRPGADPVDVREEIRRAVPVVERLVAAGVRTSIDTRRPQVAQAALEAGACAINDVGGLADRRMIELCAWYGAGACALHMRGEPSTMQAETGYRDVVWEVAAFLQGAVDRWKAAGLSPDALALDPGVGFGKAVRHNLALVAATARLRERFPKHPWYLGLSRKSWIRNLPEAGEGTDRLAGSLGGALAAAHLGCDVLRVHDVAATREAWAAFRACREGNA
jgi:dihydropteroate synthase